MFDMESRRERERGRGKGMLSRRSSVAPVLTEGRGQPHEGCQRGRGIIDFAILVIC